MWKFDREKGRIDIDKSFAIEVPPYWQDLCDAGKLASEGWAFCNSFNAELATGGIEKGNPPFEAGVSQRDMDYLHIFNWKKAEEAINAGKAEEINGMRVIAHRDGRRRRRALSGAGAEEPPRRGRDARRQVRRGVRQAGPARHRLLHRQDRAGHRRRELGRGSRTAFRCWISTQ